MRRPPFRFDSHTIVCMMVVAFAGCATHESWVQVETRHNTDKAARTTLLGIKAMESGDTDRAAEKFLAAVEADESYGPAHNNLGLLHYGQGNLYQAVLAFEQASDLMPEDPTVYYNLALALESAGKVNEALDLYWQAVEMDPANPHFLGNLIRLRIRMGESGPELITQLQDLVLIETRPQWRRWADEQLALRMNDQLDRGPPEPSMSGGDKDSSPQSESEGPDASSVMDRIIDLANPNEPGPSENK